MPPAVSFAALARIRREGRRVLTILEAVHADIESGRIDDARDEVGALLSTAREQNERVNSLLEAITLCGASRGGM